MSTVIDLLLFGLLAAATTWMLRQRRGRLLPAGAGGAHRQAPQRLLRGIERVRATLPALARQAGFEPTRFLPPFWISKVALAILAPLGFLELWGAAGLAALGIPGFGWLLLPALVGFLLPDLWLLGLRRARRRRVTRSLSYFADLLVAFLQSGLDLERAFRRAGREGFEPGNPLAAEVALVGRELDAGREPSEAFTALAERTGVPELRGIASALRMGMRMGAPVQATLEAQAAMLWTKRREAALKRIHAAAIKVMFPVMLCGFPIFFLLTFFPALLELLDAFGALGGLAR